MEKANGEDPALDDTVILESQSVTELIDSLLGCKGLLAVHLLQL